MQIATSLRENIDAIKHAFNENMDLVIREINIDEQRIALCSIEGTTDKNVVTMALVTPITSVHETKKSGEALYTYLRDEVLASLEHVEKTELEETYTLMMSGFVLLLVDGVAIGLCVGIQEAPSRGVQSLETELSIRGTKEGFCEVIRLNSAMIRRRMRSTELRFESMRIGSRSNTEVIICYMADCCLPELVDEVRRRLQSVEIDALLESGYLAPFLEQRQVGLFSQIGSTERPDVLCSKINEGRVAILVDGVPQALLVPYLFHEHFQTSDDYWGPLSFAVFSRILKLFCFFLTILFPGLYVAIGTYHPELFPDAILYNVIKADAVTPFPLLIEALLIFLIFEVMRAAGLRLAKAIGSAMSIVGALVLGQAVVEAGLVGAPMIIVVALTAIGSFIIPTLYESMAILRLVFILIGGILGLYGITIGIAMLSVAICSINNFGVPYTSPLAPFSLSAMRDVIGRQSWVRLAQNRERLQDMPGREEIEEE